MPRLSRRSFYSHLPCVTFPDEVSTVICPALHFVSCGFCKARSCCPLAQFPIWNITPCRPSATAYSTCSQLPSVSGGRFVYSVQQKSNDLKFPKSLSGSHVTYSCHHNSSRFTFPIFVYSWRLSVFHSLQLVMPRIY